MPTRFAQNEGEDRTVPFNGLVLLETQTVSAFWGADEPKLAEYPWNHLEDFGRMF